MTPDRRRSPRAHTQHRADLRTPDGHLCAVMLKNVSFEGAFVSCDGVLPVGASCHLTIHLDGAEPPVRIAVKARVARSGTRGLGLEIQPRGAVNADRLRRLVELNAPCGQPLQALRQPALHQRP